MAAEISLELPRRIPVSRRESVQVEPVTSPTGLIWVNRVKTGTQLLVESLREYGNRMAGRGARNEVDAAWAVTLGTGAVLGGTALAVLTGEMAFYGIDALGIAALGKARELNTAEPVKRPSFSERLAASERASRFSTLRISPRDHN